jgi:hypothetical protein
VISMGTLALNDRGFPHNLKAPPPDGLLCDLVPNPRTLAGYIDARPHRQDRGNLLHRTAGPYNGVINRIARPSPFLVRNLKEKADYPAASPSPGIAAFAFVGMWPCD